MTTTVVVATLTASAALAGGVVDPFRNDTMAKKKTAGGEFRFRVSDSMDVPDRGWMLRLKVVEGTPAMADLKPGRKLRLAGPAGRGRVVRIVGHAVTSGRATQDRLDRVRELDVVVAEEPSDGTGPIDIGWIASGPVDDRNES